MPRHVTTTTADHTPRVLVTNGTGSSTSDGDRGVTEDILDATTGGRTMWVDESKHRDDVLYVDSREEEPGFHGQEGRTYAIEPDDVQDFRDLPYGDASFDLIVFDPPHVTRDGGMERLTGHVTRKYGALRAETWQSDIRQGFEELFRVLRRGGTLVFKFNDVDIEFGKVLDLAPYDALFGTTTKKNNTETRFFVFRKPGVKAHENR